MKSNRVLTLGLVLAVLGGTASVLEAGSVTTTLPVTATVAAACSVSATGVSFGAYSGATINSNGTITVICPIGSAYSITLSAGNNLAGGVRRIASAGTFIPYSLFKDAARTLAWGDNCTGGALTFTSGNCLALVASGGAAGDASTVFGTVAGGLSAAAGSYSDTVVVTVIF